MGAATLNVHAKAAEGGMLVVRAVANRSPHGGGPAEMSLLLPLADFAGGEGAPGGGGAPAAQLAALCGALGGAEASARLEDALERGILAPLLGEGAVRGAEEHGAGSAATGPHGGGGGGGGGRAPHGMGAPNPLAPGLPMPLTGAPGDFDADLFPRFHGAVPGALPAGGVPPLAGGMTVGPDHPLFGGAWLPEGGPLPPGVLPGARFDPFMPPGSGGGVGRAAGTSRASPTPTTRPCPGAGSGAPALGRFEFWGWGGERGWGKKGLP